MTIQCTPWWGDTGVRRGYKETWQIQGFLQAATTAALTAAIQALEIAYSYDGLAIGLFFDDGTASAHGVIVANTIGGSRVVSGPEYGQGAGAEYSTFRSYSIVVEFDIPDLRYNVVAYSESLSFEGGGPMDLHLQPLVGFPQKQRVAEATPYRVTQEGSAIGLAAYPVPNFPIWPAALIWPKARFSRKSPKRSGPGGAPVYTEFEITWHYEFEDALPLLGDPLPLVM